MILAPCSRTPVAMCPTLEGFLASPASSLRCSNRIVSGNWRPTRLPNPLRSGANARVFHRSEFFGSECSILPREILTTREAFHGLMCRAESSGGMLEALKPGKRIESDSLPPKERNATIQAIEESGNRVTVGDVAGKSGLNIFEAERALKTLAADTNGFLEVSDEGDIVYVFPKDFKTVLLQKSVLLKLEPIFENLKFFALYLTRVTFGTALFASILLVYASIFIILTSSRSDNENRNNQRSFIGPRFYISPADLFWYWDPYYYENRSRYRQTDEMNFFEAVFSFVFGDGNPNKGFEEERWRNIGQYIKERGGVVCAEEIAPFLDTSAEDYTDESFMLPVLQRFDGRPQVDEQGNILYTFPTFQKTGSSWFGLKNIFRSGESNSSQSYLVESTWNFSDASSSQKVLTVVLGVANLVGVVTVGNLLRDPVVARQLSTGIVGFVSQILPLLQAYAASFFAIPLARWLVLQSRNSDIEKRNAVREECASKLANPNAPLKRKLANARELAQKTYISDEKIIYSTGQDVSEQRIDADAWERKLKERNL